MNVEQAPHSPNAVRSLRKSGSREASGLRVSSAPLSGAEECPASFQPSKHPIYQDFYKFFVGFGAGWRFTGDK
jgi:hypothetical protein